MEEIKERVPFNKTDFAFIVMNAMSMLRLSDEQIKDKYRNFLEYYINTDDEILLKYIIEIRFDKQETSLCCIFNKDMICVCVAIYPDKPCDYTDYSLYMHGSYMMDLYEYIWELPHGFFKILVENRDNFHLMVCV